MRLISSALNVAFFTILSRLTGFFRDILMAQYIGAGIIMDALVIAIKIPSFLRRIFAEGAFNSAFVPIFSSMLGITEEEAKQFVKDVFSLITGILIIVIIVFEVFMPYILPIVVPGFTDNVFELAVYFSRITFPFILFISLTALFSGVLNSYDRFGAAASSQIAGNLFIILIMKLVNPADLSNGKTVALAIMGSGLIQLLWVYVPCHIMGIRPSLKWPSKNNPMKSFKKRMLPAAIGSGVLQINLFIDTIIASLLPVGTLSYLYYADRLYHLPISITGTALGTVLLPLLSRQWRENNVEGAMHNQNRAIEFAMLITLPAMIGLIYLAKPLIAVIFERGAFDHQSSIATAETLAGFATGLPAYILIKIFNTSFFARHDTTTPIKVALAGMVVNIILNFSLIYKLQHIGIAIATSAASWFNAAVLVYILKKREFIAFDKHLWKFLLKVILPCILTFIALAFIKAIVNPYIFSDLSIVVRSTALAILVGVGLVTYLGISWAMGLLRFKDFMARS
jgi:putative peptidoglycan lipid II flippase